MEQPELRTSHLASHNNDNEQIYGKDMSTLQDHGILYPSSP